MGYFKMKSGENSFEICLRNSDTQYVGQNSVYDEEKAATCWKERSFQSLVLKPYKVNE